MSVAPSVGEDKSARQAFNGPDRTINWEAVASESINASTGFARGDRYLGRGVWELYLCFEQNRSSDKAIKVFMIHLGNEDVREQVEICPGLRYAFVKVTDSTMTAHKGA